jgi:CDP-diacylglycerol--glycerol-3-phosphate 3-phosphatidyltransferase
MSRILVTPIFLALIFRPELWARWTAGILFGWGAYTDYLDGYLARKYHWHSNFGALMDPLADKILLLAVMIAFVQLDLVPAWMVVTITAREFLVTGLRQLALSRGVVIAASRAGKHKTVSQIVAISVVMTLLCIRSTVETRPGAWEAMLDHLGPSGETVRSFLWGGPYWLMFYATVMSVLSGLDYLVKNRHVLGGDPVNGSEPGGK